MWRALLTCCAVALVAACSAPQPKSNLQTQASALVPCKGDTTGSLIPRLGLCAHGQVDVSIEDSWRMYERLLGPTGRPAAR